MMNTLFLSEDMKIFKLYLKRCRTLFTFYFSEVENLQYTSNYLYMLKLPLKRYKQLLDPQHDDSGVWVSERFNYTDGL